MTLPNLLMTMYKSGQANLLKSGHRPTSINKLHHRRIQQFHPSMTSPKKSEKKKRNAR